MHGYAATPWVCLELKCYIHRLDNAGEFNFLYLGNLPNVWFEPVRALLKFEHVKLVGSWKSAFKSSEFG